MPTKKEITPAQAKANATKARKKAEKEAAEKAAAEAVEAPAPTPAEPVAAPVADGKAEVIAALIKQGYSYNEAVAAVSGQPIKQTVDPEIARNTQKLINGDDSFLPPVPDAPPKDLPIHTISMETREGLENYLFELDQRLNEMRTDHEESLYELTIQIPKKLYEFFVADTLREGAFRKDVSWNEEKHLNMLLKKRLATDPTKGGRVRPSSSGPRGSYDGKAGSWS